MLDKLYFWKGGGTGGGSSAMSLLLIILVLLILMGVVPGDIGITLFIFLSSNKKLSRRRSLRSDRPIFLP
ncbi:hypothetical protein [Pseudocitrobacter faecalis]|uniref:hypothetical protein n=1 Tax=Pseudocitrobacter faecalis TaxID=1398493 RepID=UPI0040649005